MNICKSVPWNALGMLFKYHLKFKCYILFVNWKSKDIKRKGKDCRILTFSNLRYACIGFIKENIIMTSDSDRTRWMLNE